MGVFGIDPDKRVDVPNGLRRTGVTGGKGIFDKYMNQILFELKANQIWGTESQVKLVPPAATFYTDGSGDRFDKNDVAVVINEDDKILVAHDVTATANHVLVCGGKKVTLEMIQGVTWDLDTFDLTLGGAGDSIGGAIRIIQTGSLSILGNRGLSVNSSVSTYSDFTTKNLIINVQSNTTVDADADNIVFVDEFGGGKRVDNINHTFDIADRMAGTGIKLSTWYQLWLDSEGVGIPVPDLESLTDGTTANKIVDSGATFQTDKVQIGDRVYNLTDLTQTTVTAIDSETILSLADDIFTSGEDYKIRMLSPVGLGKVKARIGAAFNNSGSNFDDSTYTQIQEEENYNGTAPGNDFSVTSSPTVLVLSGAKLWVRQVNDWTGRGFWKLNFNIRYTVASATRTACVMTIGGIENAAKKQSISASSEQDADQRFSFATASASTYVIEHASFTTIGYMWSADIELIRKPTFHN